MALGTAVQGAKVPESHRLLSPPVNLSSQSLLVSANAARCLGAAVFTHTETEFLVSCFAGGPSRGQEGKVTANRALP